MMEPVKPKKAPPSRFANKGAAVKSNDEELPIKTNPVEEQPVGGSKPAFNADEAG